MVQVLAMSPCNHALFEWADWNGLCSYGDRFLAAIVLSFLKVPLTPVPSSLVLCGLGFPRVGLTSVKVTLGKGKETERLGK